VTPPEPRSSGGKLGPSLCWGRDLPSGGLGSWSRVVLAFPASSPFFPSLRTLLGFSRVLWFALAKRTAYLFPSFCWFVVSLVLFLSGILLRLFPSPSRGNPRSREANWGLIEIWEKELGASGALCAVVESQPGAFLRNVSARGNLPFLRVCQYD
jgi:hypothetical protein